MSNRRHRRWFAVPAGLLTAALAGAEPTECDRLAGHPSDPDKVLEGVSSGMVRGWNDAAVWSCRRAVAEAPDEPRLRYNLGRALFYRGDRAEALGHLAAAADEGHRQAQFVLGLMYTDGVAEILPADACRALELWSDAAARGHFAARVSLGRDLARGRYADCPEPPAREAVAGWLEAAAATTSDHYQGLPIAWTREQLSAR